MPFDPMEAGWGCLGLVDRCDHRLLVMMSLAVVAGFTCTKFRVRCCFLIRTYMPFVALTQEEGVGFLLVEVVMLLLAWVTCVTCTESGVVSCSVHACHMPFT